MVWSPTRMHEGEISGVTALIVLISLDWGNPQRSYGIC